MLIYTLYIFPIISYQIAVTNQNSQQLSLKNGDAFHQLGELQPLPDFRLEIEFQGTVWHIFGTSASMLWFMDCLKIWGKPSNPSVNQFTLKFSCWGAYLDKPK